MKKLKFFVVGVLMAFSFSSCALMFNGTTKSISVKSQTPDAKIYIDGEYVGQENVQQSLSRKTGHTIMVKKEGCKTQTLNVISKVQVGWIAFDAFVNWFAFLTDAPTGAWKSFDKSVYVVELECEK